MGNKSTRVHPDREPIVTTDSVTRDSATARYCVVCLGNPGSGKSTLLNSLVREHAPTAEAPFKSGFSAGSGMTQEMQGHPC
eukprot:5191544-Amphidinium_carterae.1